MLQRRNTSFLTLPIVVLVAAALVVVIASMAIGAREVDRIALDSQRSAILQAIHQDGLVHERELRLMTVWDDAYDAVLANDMAWMDKYLGRYLNQVLGYGRVYVLSGDGKLIYGSVGGQPGSAEAALPHGVEELISAARASRPVLPEGQMVETPIALQDGTTVRHRSVVDVLSIDGRPASVIVSTIVPDYGSTRSATDKPPLLVTTNDLDRYDVRKIGADFGFQDLHWTKGKAPVGYDAEVVRSSSGLPVAALTWQQNRPGMEFLSRIAPGLLLALLPIAALTYLLVEWGSRQVKRLVESEAQATRAARTDTLTGLPNRVGLRDVFRQLLSRAKQTGAPLAVLSIDIDHFKAINDAFGNVVGDAVLKASARRLEAMTPEHGVITRPDGDSFVMLVPGLDGAGDAELANDVIVALAEPFDLDNGTRVFITASVGYAIGPRDGDTGDELMRRAELAMRKAKEDAEEEAIGFAPEMDAEVTYRLMLEAALRASVADGSIDVVYQPLMDPSGTRVVGLEALARWTEPDLGVISPAVFIPLAEETGLIQNIGELVLRRAVEDSKAWPGITVAVNVSASQIHHGDVVEVVRDALKRSQFPPERLEIEITESVLLADEKRANEQMRGLQALGVRIALDDFGTGYSSLQYLRRFGFDKLKIDRSFIDGAGDPMGSSVVLASIIKLGQDLDLTITAEGVETEEQRRWLQASGCHQLQGYLFSRPLRATDVAAFIAAHRAGTAVAS